MTNARRTVVAAALGECVHVAGVMNFLRLAEAAGWRTVFLGPAVATEDVLAAARREDADLVGVSYRLTPETGERLLGEFAEAADELRESGVRFAFGGTPPVAERAKALQFFERVFDGSEPVEAVLGYLKGQNIAGESSQQFPQTAIERIRWKSPYPILRHHFGLPTMEDTLAGIEKIAEAQALDVISLGIDQDAQENFYHPERQDPRRKGAGGVPVRSEADYRALYAASRRGNFPLLRAYSGTDDFIRLAEMYADTIHIAWCAIPLFWFNQMDGRGPWDLEGSIREHQQVMQWYGARGIPVELNEPHHWGMRDASDAVFVAAAFLSAYNARAFGVQDYIAQMMFNSPPGLSDKMDLAKMLTVMDLITPLALTPAPSPRGRGENGFRIWKQTRIGLLSHPLDPEAARGHLAASTYLQMSLRPHIYHIVGHTEADHAATADDVIAASRVARRAIENALGAPDLTADPIVARRRAELAAETNAILDAIRALAGPDAADPFTDAATLARAVTSGILDAPQLVNNKFGRGEVRTRIVDGACVSVDGTGNPISERERIAKLI
ncbi:MAG: cobalamin B12-binding domain-containing protein [Anaerolineae bacterium CFX3]|nr:cobalamin B12-binding domain-containing protein [Anaerolineae bacterium CFX3]MCQ3946457.1 methionine synthase [Anaerolineae bacterium]RIK27437.1 MAG: methionine synthase [Anaerolineae bacterium]